jgi:hypothetical protein
MSGLRPATANTANNESLAIRVSSATYNILKEMATAAGKPITRCLDDLVQEAYRQQLWRQYAEANRSLQGDTNALAAQQAEEAIWSVADADGLDPNAGVEWTTALEDAASW